LGEEYLKRNELARAEPLLLEAYRLRKLNHLPLDVSYRSLGRLRLEQGDLISASALLDRAVEVSSLPQGWIPTWDIYHYRGRVRLAQGRLPEALADLRIAVRLARDWRWKAPTDDTSQIGAEGWLDQVHSALIEAGNRLYQQTHNPELIRETFEVAEENRSSSLRSVLSRRNVLDSSVLPSAYWEIIARLQLAEVHALRTQDTHSAESVSAIRAELVRMEVALGPELAPPPAALLDRTLAALDPSTAMLSFHLGDSVSWLWALDRHGLVLYELPKRTVIEAQAQAAASSIRENAILAPHQASAQLWNTLFTQLAPRFQNKSRWLVALDRGLFEVPLAALLDSSAIPPAYLVERHVIETIPSTGFWMEAQSRSATAMQTTFVGIGDPIYNTADPRLAESVRQRRQSANHALLLPRLVGSGNELDACSRVWRGDCVLLRGAAASRGNLLTQMQRNPAVIHIAAHFLESSQRPPYGLIALSLTPRGESQLVPPFEIAGWHTNAGLVVLSGCHSGEGAELPGTGLLGLTRAWLVAGAHSVIGSYWATPDESGALFGALYRNLSAARDGTSAVALRTAQLEMIRSGDWRSRPSFWAAYFIVGSQ
jgi:CHAT domain-containing protein